MVTAEHRNPDDCSSHCFFSAWSMCVPLRFAPLRRKGLDLVCMINGGLWREVSDDAFRLLSLHLIPSQQTKMFFVFQSWKKQKSYLGFTSLPQPTKLKLACVSEFTGINKKKSHLFMQICRSSRLINWIEQLFVQLVEISRFHVEGGNGALFRLCSACFTILLPQEMRLFTFGIAHMTK